ncbi:HD-GYP domain-containing protein [Rhizobium sp. Root564]|uniref:HD-GYP domain-containing protein n=1 Tax=Agrobacterium cavarae TaxID=2528239 RepID=UPI000713F51E|nr:hypothetical protein ASD74_02115 [Rhizobium sp. Root564]
MLKRIKPDEIHLGMFIEAIDGNWKGQRFWRSRFLLASPEEADTLRASRVEWVVINTEKGTDVAFADVKARCLSAEAQLTRALKTVEQSKPLIKSIFEDARDGNSLPIDVAMQVVDDIEACMRDSSQALIQVTRLKARDEYTFLHSIAVAALMIHFGRSIKMTDATVKELALGGLLHDVGKVKIPPEILQKSGPLTDAEMITVRQHPQNSFEILSRHGNISEAVLDICLHHHERTDGKGYPDGLLGEEIRPQVRIASICDVYDALTSRRAYKKAWTSDDAVKFMLKQEGQFDRVLLRNFFYSMKF